MVVIEDEGKLKFFDGKKELTLREGFARLDTIYGGEPQETKRVINRLKEKYMKDLTNRQVFLFALCTLRPVALAQTQTTARRVNTTSAKVCALYPFGYKIFKFYEIIPYRV